MSQQTFELLIKAKGDFDSTFTSLLGKMKESGDGAEAARKKVDGLAGAWEGAKSAFSAGLGFGAAFSIGQAAADALIGTIKAIPEAIIGAGVAAVKMASDLSDVSANTGIAVEALQRLSFAGAPTGTSLDGVAAAVIKMNQRLEEAPEKFAKWGLSAAALRQMDPADALGAISEKLRALPDQAAQTAMAFDLLGKGGGQALKFLKSDIAGLSEEAERLGAVLDEDTIQSLDNLDDAVATNEKAWEGLKLQLGAVLADNPEFLKFMQDLTDSIGALSVFIRDNKDPLKDYIQSLSKLVQLAAGAEGLVNGLRLIAVLGDSAPNVKAGQGLNFDPAPQIDFNKINQEGIAIAEKLAAAQEKAGKAALAAATRAAKPMRDWVDKVKELAVAVERAEKNHAPLDAVTKEYGRSIEEVIRQGQLFGRELPASIMRTAEAMRQAKLDELMKKVSAGWRRAADDIKKDMDAAAKAVFEANTKLLIDREEEAGRKATEQQRLAAQAAEEHRQGIVALAGAFGNLGATVGGTFGNMLQQGAGLVSMYMDATQAATKLQKAAAAVQAVQSAYAGGSVIGGAAKGAAVGTAIMPGWGTAIGAVVGGVAGYFGGKAKEKAAINEAARLRDEFIKLSGGMEGVDKIARQLGVNMATWLGSKTPAVMADSIRRMNEAMAAHEKRTQAAQAAMGALELRTKGFADQMAKGGEASERTQAAFDRLGTYAAVTFAAYVRETGDAIGAIQQMGTSLDQLVALQAEFGFGASAAVTSLLGLRDVVTANADVADSLSGINQLMKSLGEAGYQNAALFQAFGADAADLFNTLIERGVAAPAAMALMQPTLQSLWEHQQRFKDITDEATLALLAQAEQQGIVGANMKDVNERILDVLMAIGEVLGATIPAALARTGEAAEGALGNLVNHAQRASDALRAIPGVPGSSGGGGSPAPGSGGGLFGHAMGGTVPWTPGGRLVRVAEQGSEHIMSSAQLADLIGRAGAMNGGSNQGGGQMINLTVPIYIGAQQLDEVINKRIAAGYITSPR